MAILHKNITAAADIHNPKWFSGANNGDYAFKNEKGELESIDELLLPAALNFVDGSVAPPTTNSGDIYILSSGGSVNAGWGGVSLQDWVRYDGTAWNSITPQKSSLCYDKTADSLKFYNGSAWAALGGGSDTNFANTDLTFDADRNHELDSNKYILRSKLVSNADRIESFYNNSPVGGMVQDHYDKFGTLIHCVNRDSFGAFAYAVGYFRSGMDVGPKSAIKMRGFSGTGSYIKFSNQFGDPYSQIGANMPHYFLAAAGALATNKFIVGEDAVVGSESISLQGSTLIKGEGTSTGSTLALYDNDSTPNKIFEILDNGQFNIDTTNGYLANPFTIEGYPFAGTGNNPYFKIKGYGEVEILGRLSNLFNVQNGAGTKQFEVLNGTTKINGAAQINSTYFQVLTDTQKMSFNAGSGGALHHEIKTNGGGGPITTKFNIPGGGYQFIVGASAIIGTEKISLQGDTLLNANVNMPNLPTSASGLSSGDVYNDSGTLKIV